MRVVIFAGLSVLALAVSGCGQKAADPSPTATASIDAAPENAPGVTVRDAMVRLPAAPGRPGVAYFGVAFGGDGARSIAGVHVDGVERTELHETATENGISKMQPVANVPLKTGETVQFKAGGLHVMLFGVADTLKAGGTTEITLTLDNGDKVSAPARIEAVGGGMSAPMDHSRHDMSAM